MSCLLAPDPEIGAGADVESWEPHSGGSRSCGWLPRGWWALPPVRHVLGRLCRSPWEMCVGDGVCTLPPHGCPRATVLRSFPGFASPNKDKDIYCSGWG